MSETSDILDTMRSELAQMLNFSRLDDELDPNATAEGNGIFAFVTKTLLWQNQTDENIHLSIEAMKELKNLTVPLIAEIAHAGEIFSVALKSLLEDSKAFLTKTQIDQDFFRLFRLNFQQLCVICLKCLYFRRNFMVINVNIQELSNEIITQVPAAEFWSLIGKLSVINKETMRNDINLLR